MTTKKLEVALSYQESYVPPRCRKPRFKTVSAPFVFDIPQVTEDEAPLVITAQGDTLEPEIAYHRFGPVFWAAVRRKWDDSTVLSGTDGEEYIIRYLRHTGKSNLTRDECFDMAQTSLKKFLWIGETLYTRTGEPCYALMTWGMGRGHGSTALMTALASFHNYTQNNLFSACKRDTALQMAQRIAHERGDSPPERPHQELIVHRPDLLLLHQPGRDSFFDIEVTIKKRLGVKEFTDRQALDKALQLIQRDIGCEDSEMEARVCSCFTNPEWTDSLLTEGQAFSISSSPES